MTLTWSKSDQPKHPQARDIKRNCGQLLGRLDELLPCLYIAQYGASAHDLRERETQTTQGLFAVGARTSGDRPGVAPRVGLLLPLSLCRDEKARASLLEIPALIENHQSSMSDRRRAVQAKLDEAFGGDLRIEDKEGLDGFFALQPAPVFSAGCTSPSITSQKFSTTRQVSFVSPARRALTGAAMAN